MRYIRLERFDSGPTEPIQAFSEVDDDGREIRKVEIHPDGTVGFTRTEIAIHSTFLSPMRILSNSEIATDPGLEAREMSAEEFHEIWREKVAPK